MKFLSDILAKAGLTVDGVVTLNNTATGQTPAANDNSTKLATTAWVRGFVTPYILPIASGTTLGGIKIGSGLSIDGTGIVSVAASGVGAIRALQQITATAGQTVFTVSGGYTPGLIDVFLNGVLLTPTAIAATNGNSFTLDDAAISGDLLDVFVYNPIYNGFISSTDQVPEGITNFYFTNTRARQAITLTTTGVSGVASYNNSTGVLNIPNYQGLVPANGIAGQILAKASGTSYDTAWIDNYTSQVQHQVKLGASMTVGTAVYVSGSTGGSGTNMIVSKASNAAEATSSKTLGLIATGGATNDTVFVVTEGLLAGLDTSTAQAGDPVWLGTNGSLIFGLANKPVAPAHLVFIGVVTRVQSNNGEIFVKVQNGFEMGELHDYVQNGVQDGYVISYESSTSLYKPKSIVTLLGYTPQVALSGTGFVKISGSTISYDNSTYATQTYVATAISNLVASAPTTLDTLNELAAALGNDPNFATTVVTSIGTKVPQTRTITINGTSYDLSVDRTWNIAAGVTSFNTRTGAITPASGDYTTAQVTESGNLYYTNTRARLAISLTTTGTSGAATYDNITGVLNIPQYQGGVTSFNTRTGAITLSSTDVTTALAYTPVTNARTITINGTAYDLSADRSWTIAAGITSFNTRTGAITLTSGDVTTALGYTPVTNARTLTINGTAYDLAADRSWTVGVNPSARTIQTYTATASQTTFTVTGGYVVGLVDVFINGVRLTSSEFTATDGSTVVLVSGTSLGNIVDVIKYTSAFTASSALRQVSYFTATAGQTTFTVNYTPGLVDIFYNGSKLASSEYTASNGTSIVLSSGATLNDIVEVVAYAYSVGAFTGQAQLNGTGFVKVNGTTVSYDNSTYLTSINSSQVTTALGYTPYNATNPSGYITSSALSSYLPLSGGTLTGALSGITITTTGSATFGSDVFTYNNGGIFFSGGGSYSTGIFQNSNGLNLQVSGSPVFKLAYTTGAATFTGSVSIEGSGSMIRSGNELRFYRADNAIYTKLFDSGSLAANGFVLDNMNSEGFHFKNNGTTIMRMNSSGYVGIATNSPDRQFIVSGTGQIGLYGSSSGIVFNNTSKQWDISLSSNDITFNETGVSQRLIIKAGGNIGVQTSTPVVALQVGSGTVSSIPSWMRIMTADSTQTGIGAVYNNKAIYIYNNGSNIKLDAYDYSVGVALDLQVGGNGGSVIIAPSGGNLLIGTTTNGGPKIAAEGQASGWGYTFYNASGGASVKTFLSHGGAYGMAIDSSMNTAGVYLLKLASGDGTNRGTVEQFKVTGAGNVLIGGGSDAQVWMNRGLKIEGSRPGIDLVNNGGGTLNTIRWYGGVAGKELHMNFDTSTSMWALRYNSYFLSGGAASHEFFGNGNLTIAGTLTESSSIRYKENIETVENGLDKVLQLRGVTYNKKETGDKELGLIAEEVNEILPDVVIKNSNGEPDSVSYGRITAVLIEAVKDLQTQINELKIK